MFQIHLSNCWINFNNLSLSQHQYSHEANFLDIKANFLGILKFAISRFALNYFMKA